MGPWVFSVGAAALVVTAVAVVLAVRSGRRTRAHLAEQLVAAQADVHAVSERLEELSEQIAGQVAEQVAEARRASERRDAAPVVITGLVTDAETEPRAAQLVQAIEAGRPQWVPAKPLREALVRTVSVGHGVRRALSPDMRDRILLEVRAEIRRSRRQRKAELKAIRKYLRDRRKSAA